MQTEAIVTRKNERPLSKYAAKRKQKIIDLRDEPTTVFLHEEETQKEQMEKVVSLREVIRERLYSKEGGAAFHRGNPFAIAFNKVVQG